MSRIRGFSLIELLIVMAIILTIAAIAIPSLLRSRISANEASAVAAVRALTTAETAYAQTYPEIGYTCNLGDLGPPASGQPINQSGAGIIDAVLASGVKSGYSITLSACSGTPQSMYNTAAVPVTPGTTGVRAFCSDASGIIWQDAGGDAANCKASGLVLQ